MNESQKNRSGEGWWYGRREPEYDYTLVDEDEKKGSFLPFLHSLPGALERADLRVVHACWHEPSIGVLRGTTSVIDGFKREEAANEPRLVQLRAELHAMMKKSDFAPDAIRDKGLSDLFEHKTVPNLALVVNQSKIFLS